MRELLEYLASALVEQPDAVKVEEFEEDDGTLVLELSVDEAVAPLEADEYWAHELEGCTVYDGAAEVGVVRRMIVLPSCEALEVDRAGGGELLVPLVHDAIRAIDRDARRIDVDLEFIGGGKSTGSRPSPAGSRGFARGAPAPRRSRRGQRWGGGWRAAPPPAEG